jgi:uncharacterized lipoprotein YajG
MRINCFSRFLCVSILSALVLAAGGCAFVDEEIALQPTSRLPAGDVGHGQRVGVKVVDERSTTIIGRRGPQRTAEIRAVQDARQVVDDAVKQGLRNQGFEPVSFDKTYPVTLEVQLRELSYDATAGFFSGGVHTKAALKAVARHPNESFEEMYRVEEEERVVVVPTEASDAERVNLALSHVIDQMLADHRLLGFLAAGAVVGQQADFSATQVAAPTR